MPRIYFTVTNDLSYDQRMIRICTSLSGAGYTISLIGRTAKRSVPLSPQPYYQKRLYCFFDKGKLFYAEYNIRLFLFLLFKKADAVCAIDLDTILPCYYISVIKGIKRIYDAHEYFTQQKEILSRPFIYRVWHSIEKRFTPKFKNGYTVSESICNAFKSKYGVNYTLIRNMPLLNGFERNAETVHPQKIILYQGAVNEARGLETLIPAMKNIPAVLHIYGDGNFVDQTNELIVANKVQDKVFMKGKLLPNELEQVTRQAFIGLNLVEPTGLNQVYSLANKFFDFIHGGIPQVTMHFPEYKKINDVYDVAVLIEDTETGNIEKAINRLLTDESLYALLKENCKKAAKELNWQMEEKKLLTFYKNLIG